MCRRQESANPTTRNGWGDGWRGKAQLDNFVDPDATYPVIACISHIMSTGVESQTCQLIVLDRRIGSMTEFKQIIGRSTRINRGQGVVEFDFLDSLASLRSEAEFRILRSDDVAGGNRVDPRGRSLHFQRCERNGHD
jgi:type I site-specific restriction endonuclease